MWSGLKYAAVMCVLGVGVAFANDDPLANYYGNTVAITNAAGTTSVRINQDGSFDETLPDGTVVAGTWKMDGGNSCFYVEGVPPHCVPAQAHGVGDTWDVPATDGTIEKAMLIAGR
jgi:hypothetical protein